jgi:NAD(P)-dependent dehydrogenase (short-subunit alcohol dehydrogenase family)
MIALAKIYARELAPRGIRVNAACPGWVRTRMGGRSAPRSLAQGARSVVLAATLGGSATGGFYRDGKPAAW